jgi:hypothetical protein
MININKINGELKFEECFFSPRKELKYYLTLFHSDQIELWSANQNWKSYRLSISRYFILIIFFKDEILNMINVYPIAKNNDNEVSLLLEKLGGENVYPWGSVEFSNDTKAGAKSVLVKYN